MFILMKEKTEKRITNSVVTLTALALLTAITLTIIDKL